MSEITVPQLAKYLGMTPRAIISNIKKGKYPSARLVNHNKVGRGGKIWQISIDDPGIPSEIKDQFCKKHFETQNNSPTEADGDKALIPEPSASLSFPETQLHLLSGLQEQGNCPTPGGHLEQGRGYHSPVPVTFSEKSQKIALARMDLIKAWKDYRKDHRKAIDAADKDFMDAYNSTPIYKNLYDVIGNISIKTLYRWNKYLDGTEDWTRLMPLNYEKRGVLNSIEEKAFLGILLRPNRLRIGTAITLTKLYLKKEGIPSDKSDRTFRRFAERYKAEHYDLWVLAREGQKALKDKVAPYITRNPSSLEVGEVLVADGHRLNFQTINPFTGKPCRAVLVGFLDWKSYDLVGYEIMLEENVQCVLAALRNSIIRLGKIPEKTYQDNGKAFRAKFFTSIESFEELGFYGLLGRLGITPVFAQPYNARAKPIEGWFKNFSNYFEKLMPSYVGDSIKNKPPYMLRNEKLHKALHREDIYTIEETIQKIEIWLEWQRSRPCPHVEGKTIGQVFNEGRGPGIDINQLDGLMMAIEIKKVGRNGIRFLGSDYYDEPLYGFRENVFIRYDQRDLSYIKVYSMNGDFLCKANQRQPIHPIANYSCSPKDVEELKQQRSQQRKLEKKTIQGVRGLMKIGRPIELEWEKVTPKIISKLEKETLSLPDSFRTMQEAMKEFMKYIADTGAFFSQEDRALIEETINSQGLNKTFVQNFALGVRAQLARRDLIGKPIEIDRSITEKSIPFIEFLKRLIQEVGPISREMNQQLRAEYGDSIEVSKVEEVIQQLRNLPESENPENHSLIFYRAWERYEFLRNKQSLTEEEERWVEDYKEGRILYGGYEETYLKLEQQNDPQSLPKKEAI